MKEMNFEEENYQYHSHVIMGVDMVRITSEERQIPSPIARCRLVSALKGSIKHIRTAWNCPMRF